MTVSSKSIGAWPKWMGRVKFRLCDKILIFSVLLALLPLLVSSSSMITITQDELKSSVNDSLASIAGKIAHDVNDTFGRMREIMLLLRSAVDNVDLSIEEKVSLLEGSVESVENLVSLQLVIKNGRVGYILRKEVKQTLDVLHLTPDDVFPIPDDMDIFDRFSVPLVGTGKPSFIASLDTWIQPVWVPLQEPIDGRPAALLVHVNLGRLRARLLDERFNGIRHVLIIDARGHCVFGETPGSLLPLIEAGRKLLSSGIRATSIMPFQGRNGEAMLGAVVTNSWPHWASIVAIQEADAYFIISRMLEYLWFWLGLGLAVASLGAILFSRHITKPILTIARVAEEVKQGNMEARVPELNSHDEIRGLGKRFNEMIDAMTDHRLRLDYLAFHDPLSGLPNRLLIHDRLEQAIVRAEREKNQVAVLFMDLDRFKNINDSLGHEVGDQLLRNVAKRLTKCVREEDTVGRLGGDEFVIILSGLMRVQAAELVAKKIVAAIGNRFRLADCWVHIGASVGISRYPQDGRDAWELIKNADLAMYLAKDKGRGNYQCYSAPLKERIVRRLSMDAKLRNALEKQQLAVYYQPQVSLASGKILSMEALVRWPNSEEGFVAGPGEFIPIAEETGLIAALDDWVMHVASTQLQAWHDSGLPKMLVAVNVSGQQFRRRDLVKNVERTLSNTGLPGSCLELELTEGILIDNTAAALTTMSNLKSMGIKLSIDDFGTGYSSLMYLKRFPLDFLKVAQEFVRGVTSDSNDAAIAWAIISLARSLDLRVIAEGVETFQTLDLLRSGGCDFVQGYYFSRPLPATQFEHLVVGIEHSRSAVLRENGEAVDAVDAVDVWTHYRKNYGNRAYY